jgi:hypothetical protein
MTKAPRIDINSKRELHLLKLLVRGSKEFKDMNMEEKLIVWNSTVDITPVVPQEQLEAFHAEREQKTLGSREEATKSLAEKVKDIIPSPLDRGT